MRLCFKQGRPIDARKERAAANKKSLSPVLEIPLLDVPLSEIVRDERERRERQERTRKDNERQRIDISEVPETDPRGAPPPSPVEEPKRGVVIIEL